MPQTRRLSLYDRSFVMGQGASKAASPEEDQDEDSAMQQVCDFPHAYSYIHRYRDETKVKGRTVTACAMVLVSGLSTSQVWLDD